MLFNINGHRQFYAPQSNGQSRQVAYVVKDGQVIIKEVDCLPVTLEHPLPEQFKRIVLSWCDDHRANLHTHDSYRSAA